MAMNGHAVPVRSNGHAVPVQSNGHVPHTVPAVSSNSTTATGNAPEQNSGSPVRLQENVNLLYAIAVIISLVVGTGIYLTPQGVLRYAGSVHLSLVVWGVSGVIATLGAMCFAELGTTYPGSGAHYVYLERMYGPSLAFLYLWTMVFLVRPGLNALKAIVFAQYVIQPFFGDGCDIPPITTSLIAVCLVCVLGFINIYDVKLALKGQTVFFAVTLVALLIIAGTGLHWIARGNTAELEDGFAGSSTSPVDFLFALYSGTFAYAGWYCINILTEEMRNPRKILPWALGIAMCIITVLYLMVNIAYFAVLGIDGVLHSPAVATSFSSVSLGVGMWLISVFVVVNSAGSTNVGIMVASRLCFVGARRGHLPEFLGLIQITWLSPITAVLFQVCISILTCLVTRDVTWLITQMHFVVLVMDGLVVGGMIYYRFKQPKIKRPFKLPIVIPILYFFCAAVMTIVPLVTRPRDAGMGMVFVLSTALPYYLIVVKWTSKPKLWYKWPRKFTHMLQKLLLCTKQEEWSG